MNNNIFNPKGLIGQNRFIINYILLIIIYIVGGVLMIKSAYQYHLNYLCFVLPLLLIKIFIVFNYKKRILDITRNLPISIILGIFLTFDTEVLAICQFIKDPALARYIFFALGTFILFIQPLIIALIPGKKSTSPIEN